MKRSREELEESIRFFDDLRYTALEMDIERAHEEQAEKEARQIRAIFDMITKSKEDFEASEDGTLWWEELEPAGSLPPAAENTGDEGYISARELQKKAFKPKEPLIEGFLYPGTYIFAGAP